LCLAVTVFFAIKDAIAAARNDAGFDKLFPLDSPATAERIRMACVDDFTKQVTKSSLRISLSVPTCENAALNITNQTVQYFLTFTACTCEHSIQFNFS